MRVGLTGGIGSGKSAVSERLRRHGATIIDYDQLARDVVKPGEPTLHQIEQRYGPSVITPEGSLNRPALGAVVFSDPAALRDLEAITHPAIRALAGELESAAPDGSVVVHDNPLLVEMEAASTCDAVVVVDVPESVQIERLVHGRGITEAEARSRMAAQASRADRLAHATHVIDNSGDWDALDAAVDALWAELTLRG